MQNLGAVPTTQGTEDHEQFVKDNGLAAMGIIVLHDSIDFMLENESHFMERIQNKRGGSRYFCLLILN